MHYSKDELHTKIALLHLLCSKHIKEFTNFNKILSIFNFHTKEYIAKLKELKEGVLNLSFDSSNNWIYEISIKTILRFITQQIEGLEIFTEEIKHGIIEDSTKILSSYSNNNKALFDNYSILEQKVTNEVNSAISIQNDYLNKMKAFETIIIDYMTKNPSAVESDENIKDGISSRKKIEENYMFQIGRVNRIRDTYNKASSNYLNQYKEIFETIVDKYRKSFQSFKTILLLKNAHDKSIIQDIEQTIPSINDSQLETNQCLFDNIQFDKLTFEPYQLAILPERKKKNSYIENVLVYNVTTFMQKYFINISQNYNAVEEKKKNEILRISQLICENYHNKPLSQEDKAIIEQLFKVPEYRLIFLTFLNNKRVDGNCNLCKESFKQLGDMMRYIIDCIQEDKEYESMRYCLIMCQTYWFTNSKKERLYLQAKIENHPLFQNEDFWEFFFSDSLLQEINRQNNGNANQMETDEEKNYRFGNIAFSQLISLGHSMMDFNVDKKKIKNIITVFAKQYCVSQELIEQIYELINEVVYEEKKPFNEDLDLCEEVLLTQKSDKKENEVIIGNKTDKNGSNTIKDNK